MCYGAKSFFMNPRPKYFLSGVMIKESFHNKSLPVRLRDAVGQPFEKKK